MKPVARWLPRERSIAETANKRGRIDDDLKEAVIQRAKPPKNTMAGVASCALGEVYFEHVSNDRLPSFMAASRRYWNQEDLVLHRHAAGRDRELRIF